MGSSELISLTATLYIRSLRALVPAGVDEPQVEGDGAVSRMDAPYPAVAIGPTMGFV